MVLRNWWLLGLWLPLLSAVWWLTRRPGRSPLAKPIANSQLWQELPAYQTALRRYKWWLYGLLAATLLLLSGMIGLSLRPASRSLDQPELYNRDIVLCLDVSGSMTSVDAKLADTFAGLAKSFKGERLSLVIFDSSSATIFPLTDDYQFVATTLQKTKQALAGQAGSDYDLYSGVSEGQGSSLIGDGLASCVLRFDQLGTKRSRSIILATDNQVNGSQIVSLAQAAALAKQKQVQVFGLNPNDFSDGTDTVANEFRQAVLATGGNYYALSQASATGDIVSKISQQQAARFKGSPQLVISDQPQSLLLASALLLPVVLVICWRLDI